ncbi:Protein of unknown function [Tenacibaculum sp. MAR_2009_124]|uniref:DUF2750 domain-containing protein n=1 Tax=Tenacibaculum sp. MAR_2009_124 TaxID=1250059 RepID=UPI00089A43F6|nr:DUF2750 domain-containing protein [Tenacibaculum sp. MAR_2009_124]SEB75106.1 Protein of unknown function [Tenacibaculum sp. MAR_2009_124]
MHPKQIENLLKLNNEERVEYFIRYCADFEEVWGLSVGKNEWVIFKDADGDEIFPLWSHKDLAEFCAFDEHKEMGAKPSSISVYSFIDEFLDDPDLKNVYFGVFYNKNREALVLKGENLKKELEAELEKHE